MSPQKDLIGAEWVRPYIDGPYRPYVDLLKEMASYYANLIPLLFGESSKKLEDIVLLLYLGKHVLSMLDGIAILVENGAIPAATLQVRAIFETHLYIEWMLKQNTPQRARHYFVWTLRHKKLWASRSVAGTQESNEFQSILKKGGTFDFSTVASQIGDEAKSQIVELDKILSQKYKAENDAFDALRKKQKKDYDPEWYALSGATSVRNLAKQLNKLGEYMIFYGKLSGHTHATATSHHTHLQGNELILLPIRMIEEISLIMQMTMSYTLSIYMAMSKIYSEHQAGVLALTYATQWRGRFLSIPQVKMKFSD